ncbi:uncharacterized protein [Diadema setosum]|uniref:uncharacterized protein n=1 Tax=Diadema setosum TaxID=31175 RepID=UPI003B3BCAFE
MDVYSQLIKLGKEAGLTGKELVDFARDEKEKLDLKEEKLREEQQKEREERQKEREHLKEMKELELQIAAARPRNDSPSNGMKKVKLPLFNEKTDDLDSYLCRFERYAESMGWARTQWALPLSTLLTGKGLEVYSRMPSELANDYDELKAALLQRYELNEEGFRAKFRSSQVEPGETHSQLAERLKRYLLRWLELAGFRAEFDDLIQLMIMDQIYARSSKELKQFVRERHPANLNEMTKLADQYSQAHPHKEQKNHSYKDQKRPDKGQNQGHLASKFSGPQGNKGSSGCYVCGKAGHLARNCQAKTNSPRPNRAAALDEMKGSEEKTSQDRKGAACIEANTVRYETARQPGSYVKLASGDEIPLLEAGCSSGVRPSGVNMPVLQGKVGGHVVSVLRDSGCSTAVVKSVFVRTPQIVAGQKKRVVLIDGTVREFPIARVWVDTPFYTGEVEALVMEDPMYELILGNIPGVRDQNNPDPQWSLDSDEVVVKEEEMVESSEGGAVETRGQKAQIAKPLKPLPTASALSLATSKGEYEAAQKADPTLAKAWRAAESGQKTTTSKGNESKFLVHRGLLYREFQSTKLEYGKPVRQLAVPSAYRDGLMALAHDGIMSGHLKTQKTLDRLQQSFYWPGMGDDVRRYCISCDICQRTVNKGSVGRVPLASMPLIDTPFKRVAIDLVGPFDPKTDRGNRYVLTLVDYATRYPEAIALPSIETERVAEALVEMFSRLGLPDEILSDRGAQFTSELMRELGRLLSVKQLNTTPYHPMCNGLVERFNGTLKAMLRRMSAERPKDWDRYLPALLFAYREVPQASLSFSPFELLYGRTVRGPLSLIKTIWEAETVDEEVKTTYEYVVDLRARLEETCKVAHEELKRASKRYAKYYDAKARDRKFEVGDKVLIMRPTSASKLLMQWQGPYTVTGTLGRCDVRVEVNGKVKTYHVNLLKKYVDRARSRDNEVQANAISVVEEEVESDLDRPCIGLPALAQNESVADVVIDAELTESQAAQVADLLNQFDAQLTDVPGRTNAMECSVTLTTADPVVSKPYPLPQSMQAAVKAELSEMLNMGVIEKSRSKYASPIVLVKRKDGSNRFCVDYRKLNAITVFDPEPIPIADTLLAKLSRGKYFSKFDLSKGYWQIPMAESDKEKTAFVTAEGLFHFTVLPFGMVNAPATFSRLMREVLFGLDNVVNYIDDILVFSETWEEHLDSLQAVLSRLADAGLTAKPSKCHVGFKTLDFLGHVVGGGTLKPHPEKVEQILQAEVPQTKREVRAFLGLAGYYRKFIPNFAAIAAPLSDLTKKDRANRVDWGPLEEQAFNTLKSRLTSSPILHLPDHESPFILATDASDVGIGAVLMQRVEGEKFPIAYISRKLSDTERRYAVIERECLAIAWAVKKFDVYLYGREFELEVDHRPLMYIAKAKLQNNRVLRWALALQSYRYHVTAVKGTDNVGADFLSRCPE